MGYHGNRHRIAGGILGTIGKVVGGAVKGFITKGPLGAFGGAIGGAVSAGRTNANQEIINAGTDTRGDAARLARVHAQHAVTIAAKAPLGNPGMVAIAPGAMMNVSGGGGGGGRRRMNWANSRALGRAERRIKSAVHHMTKYIRWVHPTRQGHAAPKFKKGRR